MRKTMITVLAALAASSFAKRDSMRATRRCCSDTDGYGTGMSERTFPVTCKKVLPVYYIVRYCTVFCFGVHTNRGSIYKKVELAGKVGNSGYLYGSILAFCEYLSHNELSIFEVLRYYGNCQLCTVKCGFNSYHSANSAAAYEYYIFTERKLLC